MNTRVISAIARKDLLEVRQNKMAWMPMVIVPLIFLVVFPLAFMFIPPNLATGASSVMNDPDLQTFFQNMPQAMMATLEGLNDMQMLIVIMLGYMFAPMFLIFPLMASTVIAAESFAGERERKTMEALLYTPATDSELFMGKVIAGLVPAILISWGSFLFYILILNAAGWPIFGRIWFPLPSWYPLIFWISPALALLGVAFTVLISSKTQTFMGAYQASASLVVLVVGLVLGQVSGVVYLGVGLGMVVGVVVWIIAAVLTVIAVRSFNRSRLLVTIQS